MNVLGLITARGGSKGIPGKNLYPLGGRPLLFYTCDAARRSKRLTRILLSTDDSDIAEAGKNFGVEVPFLRPAALAQDTTSSLEVALQALAWLRSHAQRWGSRVTLTPRRDLALVAVQGPRAREIVWHVFPELEAPSMALAPFNAALTKFLGTEMSSSR